MLLVLGVYITQLSQPRHIFHSCTYTMGGMRSFRFLMIVICLAAFTFTPTISKANQHPKKLPSSAVIVGTVYCDTCFEQGFSKFSHFISGASVVVECRDHQSKSTATFREESKTNEYGEFKVHLPTSISKHVDKIKAACSVKLQSSSEPNCAVASSATSSSTSLHLKSKSKQGTQIFSAGFFTFKPQQQPDVCAQKPNLRNSDHIKSLGKLPPLPGKKNGLIGDQKTIPFTSFFPLPPFFPSPPPLIPLPPNPFQPPPPSLFPPNPFHPSPPSGFFPPIPFLSPPPSPPPPVFPFPPFPFPPGFPGVPPGPHSLKKSP